RAIPSSGHGDPWYRFDGRREATRDGTRIVRANNALAPRRCSRGRSGFHRQSACCAGRPVEPFSRCHSVSRCLCGRYVPAVAIALRARRPMTTAVEALPRDTLLDRNERLSVAAYMELLSNLTKREIKGRYSQSFFGFAWAIAQPLATMLVFTFVFGRLGQMGPAG